MPSLRLPCSLSDADRLTVSADLTQVIYARELEEAAKKEATKAFTGRIKEHRAQEHSLNESLRTGLIEREIEVEDRADYVRGVVETFRLDTDPPVVVKVRQIDPDERQVKLGLAVSDAQAADGPPTEEQELAGSPEEAEELRNRRLAADNAERAREDRLTAWLAMLMPQVMVFDVLDAAEGEDKYEARAPEVFGEGVKLSALGQEPDEARAALRDVLIEMWRRDDEKREHARKERVLEKVGEEWAKVTTREVDGGIWVAHLDAGPWTMEADGVDDGEARRNLRTKLIAKFEAEEDEIGKLAAEQVTDAKKDGLRVGLKAPRGSKKGKRLGKINVKDTDGTTLAEGDTSHRDDEPPAPPPDDTIDPGAGDEGRAF